MSVEPANRPSSAKKGLSGAIRRLKLKYPDLTDSDIARRVGCRPSNVSGVLKTFLGKNSEADLRQYQDAQADVFDTLSMKLLASVTQKKIDKTPAVQAITGAAILIDKARLIRGQATGIQAHVLIDVVEALRAKHSGISQIAPNPQAIGTTLDGEAS